MASAASVPVTNLNTGVVSQQNNGLARNTMRSSSNQKAADAARKQSPGGSDGLLRYALLIFPYLVRPCLLSRRSDLAGVSLLKCAALATYQLPTPSTLDANWSPTDDQRLKRPGVRTRMLLCSVAPFPFSKTDTLLNPKPQVQ
jgi:hypothetical protein